MEATINSRIGEAKEVGVKQAIINADIQRGPKDMVREQASIINPRIQKAAKDMVREQETIINPRIQKAAKEVEITIVRGTHAITVMINIQSTGRLVRWPVGRVIIMTTPHRMLVDMTTVRAFIISGSQREQKDMMRGA